MQPNQLNVTCLASASSIAYSQHCLHSLLYNCQTPISLTIITDTEKEIIAFKNLVRNWAYPSKHSIEVIGAETLQKIGLQRWAKYPNLIKYTQGHPCWRKVTDPFVLAKEGPVVVIDPDVFFLRPFHFPVRSGKSITLMWQSPNCLYPAGAVDEAFATGMPLADHVDIGIAIVNNRIDWEWLDQFLGGISLEKYSSFMHIEAIVWSALAMHQGGCYLHPKRWYCYQASWHHKLRRRLGFQQPISFSSTVTQHAIAIHAGGIAKHQIAKLIKHVSTDSIDDLDFLDLTQYANRKWNRKKLAVSILKKLGVSVG
jgi:hypothetical protein